MAAGQCTGSGIVLDGPDGATDLTCPQCGRRVPVELVARPYAEAPRWRVRGHRA